MKLKYIDLFILLVLIWAGMILGISFLEAPVKFTAPSLTMPVALDVGRHVFGAFNKVEIVFATLLVILSIAARMPLKITMFAGIVVLLLLLQCFWLLPVLDARAIIIIAGGIPEGGTPHIWYIIFDLTKLTALICAGMLSINKKSQH
jgi:hypothetical protein